MACVPKVAQEMVLHSTGFKQYSEIAKDYLGHKLAFYVGFRLDHSAQTCFYNQVSVGADMWMVTIFPFSQRTV